MTLPEVQKAPVFKLVGSYGIELPFHVVEFLEGLNEK